MRRVLVTGASGFAGIHLCRLLRERGYEVVTAASGGEVDYCLDVRDVRDVREAVLGSGACGVFHLAGLAFVPAAESHSELADAVNRGGTAHVLDAAFDAGARTLVVSSGSVYGRVSAGELPAREDAALRPVGAYAESKAAAERECERRAERQQIVVVRAFNHTGPGQAREFVCSDFAAQIAEFESGSRPSIEVGDLRSERDFSDVRDVVEAYVAAFEHGRAGEAYNVCSAQPTSAERVLEILCRLSGVSPPVAVAPERLRSGEVTRVFGSHEKLTAATGWRPTRALEQTLADLLEDWRQRLRQSASAS